jgi:hypothetical protein
VKNIQPIWGSEFIKRISQSKSKIYDVIINKKKTGFSLPINNWLHEAVNSMNQQKNYSNEDSWARTWSKALIGQKFDL